MRRDDFSPRHRKRRFPLVEAFAIAALLAAGGTGVASAQPSPDSGAIYGSQLMTDREKMQYRQKLRQARTPQEREGIRVEHHLEMLQRAQRMGVTLPDQRRRDPRQ
jgi:hypothetical protein